MRACMVTQRGAEANEQTEGRPKPALPCLTSKSPEPHSGDPRPPRFSPNIAPQALWEACGPSGTDEQVRTLLAAGGCDVNLTGPWADVGDDSWRFDGSTPLHYAAYYGRAGAVASLLQAGAEVDARDKDGSTPLHAATRSCRIDVVQQLLAAGADVNTQDALAGSSSLHIAARPGGCPELVRALLAAGADLDARDDFGANPLHDVALTGRVDSLRVLLEAGANVHAIDEDGSAAIHFAAKRGYHDMCRELIRAGADPMAPREDGQSALVIACSMRRPEIVRILLSAPGADPNTLFSADGFTALHISACLGDVGAVLTLLECGARADVKGMRGCVPLHTAAQSVDASTVRALLFEGSGDANAVDDEGSTPVVYALDATTHEPALFVLTLETLLENGADPDKGTSPIRLALLYRRCRKEAALIASYSAALPEITPVWLVLGARDAATQRLSELTEADGVAFGQALEGALTYVVEGHARAAAHAAAAAAAGGDAGDSVLARELLLLPHRRLAALRDKWLAAMLRELAFSSLKEGVDVERAAAAAAFSSADGPGGLGAAGAAAAAEGAPPPRRIPHTAVWRLAMARLLRRCAEEAEADAADRSTKALAAAVGAPPLHAGGPAAASEGAKLRYAAVMCVAKWAEVAQVAREARGVEGKAAEALGAARAQCSDFLSRTDALARAIALRLSRPAARGGSSDAAAGAGRPPIPEELRAALVHLVEEGVPPLDIVNQLTEDFPDLMAR